MSRPRFQFSGIKAFAEDQDVALAPITLVFGRNSAGKSTLIQSLLLLKQTMEEADPAQPSLIVNGTQTQLGSFRNLVHRHEKQRPVQIGATWPGSRRDRRPTRDEFLSAGAKLSFKQGRSEVKLVGGEWRWDYGAGECRLPFEVRARRTSAPTRPQQSLSLLEEDLARRQLHDFFRTVAAEAVGKGVWAPSLHRLEREWRRDPTFSEEQKTAALEALPGMAGTIRLRNLPAAQRFGSQDGLTLVPDLLGAFRSGDGPAGASRSLMYGDPGVARMRPVQADLELAMFALERAIRAADNSLVRLAGSVTYIGPYRQPPERLVLLTGEQVDSVGIQGENTIGLLARSTDLRAQVDTWLERLEVPYKLAIERLETTKATLGDVLVTGLEERASGTPVGIRDVGFGVSQLLPLIVQAVVGRSGTLVIEQPELHVHPRLQAQLGDLFVEQASAGRRFLLETHSEHLILRLLRKIRSGDLDPDDLSVLYVDRDGAASSSITRLRVDEEGEFLEQWPHGFFAERREELLG